jgi:dihydrofolate synthase/folylpolyglutamate synthase
VLVVVQLLQEKLPAAQSHIREGLSSALVPGRFQYLPTKVPTILDVAHNPHAAEALAQTLRAQTIQGRTLAVFGMLKDKDIAGVVRALAPCVAEWHCISLPGPRGAQAWELATMLQAGSVSGLVILHSDIEDAYAAATAAACAQDRIVVFGSFYTVAGLLAMGIIKKVV